MVLTALMVLMMDLDQIWTSSRSNRWEKWGPVDAFEFELSDLANALPHVRVWICGTGLQDCEKIVFLLSNACDIASAPSGQINHWQWVKLCQVGATQHYAFHVRCKTLDYMCRRQCQNRDLDITE